MTTTDEHAERFTHLRPLLFTIAYEILGSATESDDVLQDSYLRWANVDLATVRDSKSYLAQLVTRQALNALREGARRREEYVGPWLPEPLLLDDRDASADVVLAESVSMAMLVLLETLTPDERAVFVLREVFGFDYEEIAGAVGKSVGTVRQMAHRAREHVQARRKRFGPVDAKRTEQITEQFLTAASTGDMDGLLALLAPGATWTADHGGKATALPRPLVGARMVAGVMVALFRAARRRDIRFEMAVYNSAPAVVIYSDGDHLEGLFVFEVIDDKITNLYAVRNPDKLAGDHDPAIHQPLALCHARSVRIERLGDLGSAPAVLRAVADAAAGHGLPPPAALIGEWFGSGAVIAPSLAALPVECRRGVQCVAGWYRRRGRRRVVRVSVVPRCRRRRCTVAHP